MSDIVGDNLSAPSDHTDLPLLTDTQRRRSASGSHLMSVLMDTAFDSATVADGLELEVPSLEVLITRRQLWTVRHHEQWWFPAAQFDVDGGRSVRQVRVSLRSSRHSPGIYIH